MRSIFLASIVTLWTLTAAAIAPGIDAQKWDVLTKKTLAEGEILQNAYGLTVHLARVVPPDTTKARSANYFTGVVNDNNGTLIPRRFDVISEDWSINAEGNWLIEQFILSLSPQGDLQSGIHQIVIETPGMTVIKSERFDMPVGAPETLAVLKSRMDGWFNWLETNPPKF